MKRQPWIYSAGVDGIFILAPALVVTAFLLLFHSQVSSVDQLPTWAWGVLIIGVDVAHVYSTLFRTYADPDEFHSRRTLYLLTPILCWVAGVILYSLGSIWFWRAIAYLAVFHFVRQQYGFMMIYGRRDYRGSAIARWIDLVAIYTATLYPLVYWHTHLPRKFDWFTEEDFFSIPAPWVERIGLFFYIAVLVAYLTKELAVSARQRSFNVPKNALLAGTAASWWVGIVAFDSDLAFTALNVLAHGIPYMALIWIYGRNQSAIEPEKRLFRLWSLRRIFSPAMLPVFMIALAGLAYLEEGLWDGFVWLDHKSLFAPFQILPLVENTEVLAILVPLLALPQLTHYALDGFIWRLNTPDTEWKRILFYREQAT